MKNSGFPFISTHASSSRPLLQETLQLHAEAFDAVRKGDSMKLQKLLPQDSNLFTKTDDRGRTLMTIAASKGDNKTVLALLTHAFAANSLETFSAMINHRDAEGNTPLALAVAKGSLDVVQSLLRHAETDVNLANHKKETPLFQAVQDPLRIWGLDEKTGYLASPDMVQILLKQGSIKPSLPDERGNTPLHLALSFPMGQLIAQKIAEHPNTLPDQQDGKKNTPLELAITVGAPEVVKALLSNNKINPNRLNHQGKSPLWQALDEYVDLSNRCEHKDVHWREKLRLPRHEKILETLLTCPKVQVNAMNKDGQTPLTFLCSLTFWRDHTSIDLIRRINKKWDECFNYVLKITQTNGNFNINALDANGMHPINIAIKNNCWSRVGYLWADKRIDPNVITPELEDSKNGVDFYHRLFPKAQRAKTYQEHVDRLLIPALKNFSDFRNPDGTVNESMIHTNYRLGCLLAPKEHVASSSNQASQDCTKDSSSFRLTLALEQAIRFEKLDAIPAIAKALLEFPSHQPEHFNLNGIEISRNEVQNWAAGKLQEGIVNNRIEAGLARMGGAANVHLGGLTTRGRRILDAIIEQTPADRCKTVQEAVSEIREAIAKHFTDEKMEELAIQGLQWALVKNTQVEEGLNTNSTQALAAMWSYAQSRSSLELTQNLTQALLRRLADIGAEKPCNTGCVQRILYTPEGIDLHLTSGEPDRATMRAEIMEMVGKIQERFEKLYGASERDLSSENQFDSAFMEPLTEADKKMIALYQDGKPVDELQVIRLKHDIARAAITTELVKLRGWDKRTVQGELENVLGEEMQFHFGTDPMEGEQNQAAKTLARYARVHVAKKSYQQFNGSQMWRQCEAALRRAGKLSPSEKITPAKLSSLNLSALRQKLGRLTDKEAALFERMMQQKYFAVHFTNAKLDKPSLRDSTLSIFSKNKLAERDISFKNSTAAGMTSFTADHCFAFFSLECGKSPKKLESRFGKTAYRVPFDLPIFMQVAWGSLDHLGVLMPDRRPGKHIPNLNDEEAKAITQTARRRERDQSKPDAYDDIFTGKDLIAGAALSIISRLRTLEESLSDNKGELPPLIERLLGSSTESEIDGLLNGIHRPLIRVPEHLISDEFQKFNPRELERLKMARNH